MNFRNEEAENVCNDSGTKREALSMGCSPWTSGRFVERVPAL